MNYTVKQLSRLAGVSTRTLHFYDEIGLLKPESVGENGYRYYGEGALLRLQQILFFKELDFKLAEIKEILDRPGFDLLTALQAQRAALQERAVRLGRLIGTVDKTIRHLRGELDMTEGEFYEGFSEEQQREYAQEASERWGAETVAESQRRWESYSHEQRQAIGREGDAILKGIVAAMPGGYASAEVQELVAAYRRHIGYFYECTLEIFSGLGQGYNSDPRFIKFYQTKYHPEMPEFLSKAIEYYCARQ